MKKAKGLIFAGTAKIHIQGDPALFVEQVLQDRAIFSLGESASGFVVNDHRSEIVKLAGEISRDEIPATEFYKVFNLPAKIELKMVGRFYLLDVYSSTTEPKNFLYLGSSQDGTDISDLTVVEEIYFPIGNKIGFCIISDSIPEIQT